MKQGFWEVVPKEFEQDEKGRFFYRFGDAHQFSLEFEPKLFGGWYMGLYMRHNPGAHYELLLPKIDFGVPPICTPEGLAALGKWASEAAGLFDALGESS